MKEAALGTYAGTSHQGVIKEEMSCSLSLHTENILQTMSGIGTLVEPFNVT